MDDDTGIENSESCKSETNDLDKKAIGDARADFITSIILFLFGLFVLRESLSMPVAAFLGGVWYAGPGVFPAFLGSMIMLTALILFQKAFRVLRGHKILNFHSILAVVKTKTMARWGIALVLVFLYIYGFLGRIHYTVATSIYLAANMIIFTDKQRTKLRMLFYILLSVGLAVVVAVVFQNFARIPLP